MLDDEQILFKAVVMAEADGVELPESNGASAVRNGWMLCNTLALAFSWV